METIPRTDPEDCAEQLHHLELTNNTKKEKCHGKMCSENDSLFQHSMSSFSETSFSSDMPASLLQIVESKLTRSLAHIIPAFLFDSFEKENGNGNDDLRHC